MKDTAREIAKMVMRPDFDAKSLGRVVMREDESGLIILNYTAEASFSLASTWNRFEKVCRGLIINRATGEIVARPFEKMFNVSEDVLPPSPLVSVTDKVDGSLGLLIKVNGEYRITTRGAFHSEQAEWATAFFNRDMVHRFLSGDCRYLDKLTFLFEIIYPANRIVVDYNGREDLVLLGVIERQTGHDYGDASVDGFAKMLGLSRPERYDMNDVAGILDAAKSLDVNREGWVLRFADGSRWKVKGDAYKQLARMLSTVSFTHTVEAIGLGAFDDMLARLPDDYAREVRQWDIDIEHSVAAIQAQVWEDMPRAVGKPRKEFAQWVMAERRDTYPLYFAALDGRDTRAMILKRFAENGMARW